MRLIEIRLLDGPNIYRLDPAVKIEVALGRRRTWYGQRVPGRHALVRLSEPVPARGWPDAVASLVAWVRRLRTEHDEGTGGVAVHRSSDPGHWIVAYPWRRAERAEAIAEAALSLTERNVSPSRRVRLTGGQTRTVERWNGRLAAMDGRPPSWVRDADRRVPAVSISGTNGKSTVTRLTTHILLLAGRRVGTTTSDGVLVDERMVEPGDYTGPSGAAQILQRDDIDVAVLETARGGIVLRGVGYESNDASVLTNVSSDHLDLQGIHTLPELAEVKATICRITKPDGLVVLNGDDPFVAATARRVRAPVAFFSLAPGGSPLVRRHLARGGRAYLLDDGQIVERQGAARHAIVPVADVPIAIAGLARHNVANALAASGAARALGASIEDVRNGLTDFRPSSERSPGRLNIFRIGSAVAIVDFAHNEAGVNAVLDVADGIAAAGGNGAAPVTMIIGTAGDRPDDTLRGIGAIAGRRVQRIAIKETIKYLRGRSRESMIGELLAGVRSAKYPTADIPVYETETEALERELARADAGHDPADAGADPADAGVSRVVVLMCHEEREEVFSLLQRLGARPLDVAKDLAELLSTAGDARRP